MRSAPSAFAFTVVLVTTFLNLEAEADVMRTSRKAKGAP
jgi:hypothetical protein